MSNISCILLDLLLLAFFCGGNILDIVLPPRQKQRRLLKSMRKQFRNARARNLDLLSARQLQEADLCEKELEDLLAETDDSNWKQSAAFDDRLQRIARRADAATAPTSGHDGHRCGFAAGLVETLAVSIGVAFGIRALFVQPFKIPTGSMQPTLYGIHFTQCAPEEDCAPGRLRRIFDYANYSRRYVELKVPAGSGPLLVDWWNARPLRSAPLFPRSAVPCQDLGAVQGTSAQPLVIPASVTDVRRIFALELNQAEDTGAVKRLDGGRCLYQPGQAIAHGAMESGDHLFVNRLSLCFRAPRRGDMMVFSTSGITYRDKPLGGDFYIKRLVGMPGDTLKLQDNRLWIRPRGESEFHLADAEIHPDFAKINSMKDGYSGYSIIPYASFLNQPGAEYTVPDECYFMLGDNTNNSLDSRFWGTVPRRNLVGRPCFVWWPFSRRFGFTS